MGIYRSYPSVNTLDPQDVFLISVYNGGNNYTAQVQSSVLQTLLSSVSFNAILSGVNNSATMVVDTGASLTATGSGIIEATAITNTAVTPGFYTNANITVGADGRITTAANGSAGGGGTVTSVSVVTANGISGSVATATTTPAITLTLGAITPTSVAASGAVTGSNLSGTNTGDQTITLTGEVTGSGTGSFSTTVTNAAVIAKVLTGFVAAPGTVIATDTILQAFQKLAGNVSSFTSSQITYTNNSVGTPIAHGLGAIPGRIEVNAVCQSNDAGYTTGQVIYGLGGQITINGANNFGIATYADATNIYYNINVTGIVYVTGGATPGTSILDATKWKLVFRAYAS